MRAPKAAHRHPLNPRVPEGVPLHGKRRGARGPYLLAMERGPVRDTEIRHVLRDALTDRVADRQVYMRGIDASYRSEGYDTYPLATDGPGSGQHSPLLDDIPGREPSGMRIPPASHKSRLGER